MRFINKLCNFRPTKRNCSGGAAVLNTGASRSQHTVEAIDGAIAKAIRYRKQVTASDTASRVATHPTSEAEVANQESQTPQVTSPSGKKSRLTQCVQNVETVVGNKGTFERGFILTAACMIVPLLLGRLIFGNESYVGIVVPMLMLVMILATIILKGIQPVRGMKLINTRIKQALVGVLCAPLLTILAPGSCSRSSVASLWTAWAGLVLGTVATFSV